ncbi:hypothetical protein ABT160_13245 [Streptomyces sp. NPDC001941]|uniref:hypothetical protein n=1 Tax=Streptomyces sp. NPDC001941 TaxID=3154659 RepID=UPI00331AB8F8
MTAYEHLGWDPAPGSPTEIAALAGKLGASAKALGTAHDLVTRLLAESGGWRGEAAGAFREALDGELPGQLGRARRSLAKAAGGLTRWHDDLVGYRETARRYDARAARDTTALRAAEGAYERARTTGEDLEAAGAALTRARAALASVLVAARELEETHRAGASAVAKCLEGEVGKGLRGEVGWLERGLGWVDENLGDLLSDVSAVSGLLAVTVGALFPPVGVALLFVAAGASTGALAVHLADPKVRASLKDGLTRGKCDAEFWDNAVTVTGDALGSVPGVAVLGHGARSATAAARVAAAAGEAGSLTGLRSLAGEFAGGAHTAMSELRTVENPLSEWALRRASPTVRTVANVAVPATGAATAVSHYTPLDEDEAFSGTATVVDGARTLTDDAPGTAAKAAHAWTSLSR